MLIVLPFHAGDVSRTKDLLAWIKDLGGVENHPILLVVDVGVDDSSKNEIKEMAKAVSSSTLVIKSPISPDVICKWKPNEMFLSAAKWINDTCKMPWLWLESDCIPLRQNWADHLIEEYESKPVKFVGPVVRQNGQVGLPEVYLNGTAIYPHDAYKVYEKMERLRTEIVAWDIESAPAVIGRSMPTNLIHHFWGEKDLPPTFVDAKTPDNPKNFVTLDFIKKGAVLFHRSKDGSLISLLRKQRSSKSK